MCNKVVISSSKTTCMLCNKNTKFACMYRNTCYAHVLSFAIRKGVYDRPKVGGRASPPLRMHVFLIVCVHLCHCVCVFECLCVCNII